MGLYLVSIDCAVLASGRVSATCAWAVRLRLCVCARAYAHTPQRTTEQHATRVQKREVKRRIGAQGEDMHYNAPRA
jgi:hypothetical protein